MVRYDPCVFDNGRLILGSLLALLIIPRRSGRGCHFGVSAGGC